MPVPSDIALTPDERQLCNEISKAREHLAKLEEDLLILRSNQPQRPAIKADEPRAYRRLVKHSGLEDYIPNSEFRRDGK